MSDFVSLELQTHIFAIICQTLPAFWPGAIRAAISCQNCQPEVMQSSVQSSVQLCRGLWGCASASQACHGRAALQPHFPTWLSHITATSHSALLSGCSRGSGTLNHSTHKPTKN